MGIIGTLPQPDFSESELLTRAQAGDGDAFWQLARPHAERLWRTALTLCRDAHLAEDLVQETLAEAWKSLVRFDGRCRLTTWLHAILVHRHGKALRHASSRPRLLAREDAPEPDAPEFQSPADDLLAAEGAAELHAAVAALPEEHRAVIELRFFADLALEEIAAALSVPLGTVKSRLHHGLEKLRRASLSVNLLTLRRES